MYEMEGPRGLTARTGRLLGRPALRGQPPVPETRLKRRLPGSSSVPGSPPDGPVSNGECIFTASREVPQGLSASYLKILWPSTQSPQNARSYPPARGAFHRAVHKIIHNPVSGAWTGPAQGR